MFFTSVLCSFLLNFLFPVGFIVAQNCATDDELSYSVSEWMKTVDSNIRTKEVNGHEMCVGYFPGGAKAANSGITIGLGVDLGRRSKSALRDAGVPQEVLDDIDDKFFKPKNAAQARQMGIRADDLVMYMDDCLLISSKVGVNKDLLEMAKAFGKRMSCRGKDVLFSLKRWCAGNIMYTNACIQFGKENPLWTAIKGKTATDQTLKAALLRTRALAVQKKNLAKMVERLDMEIEHLNPPPPKLIEVEQTESASAWSLETETGSQ